MKLKEVPGDNIYFDFENFFDFNINYGNDVVITGNRDFISLGNEVYIDIIHGDYYDDDLGYSYETLEELKKISGKEWQTKTIVGYSQSDWQDIYFTEEIKDEMIKTLEAYYFGKIKELVDEEDRCSYYVTDDVFWRGKKAICEDLGLDPETTTVEKISGSHVVYDYEPLEEN